MSDIFSKSTLLPNSICQFGLVKIDNLSWCFLLCMIQVIRSIYAECVTDERTFFWCTHSNSRDMVKYTWIRMRARRPLGQGFFLCWVCLDLQRDDRPARRGWAPYMCAAPPAGLRMVGRLLQGVNHSKKKGLVFLIKNFFFLRVVVTCLLAAYSLLSIQSLSWPDGVGCKPKHSLKSVHFLHPNLWDPLRSEHTGC